MITPLPTKEFTIHSGGGAALALKLIYLDYILVHFTIIVPLAVFVKIAPRKVWGCVFIDHVLGSEIE